LAERDPWIPVPVNAIVAGEPGALLVSEMVPETLVRTEAGVKVALKLVLCPALSVKGKANKPLVPKPAPDGLTAVMVRAALPVLLSVTLCEPELPTATLPKLTLAGLMVNCGCACVPAPLKEIVRGEPGASLAIEILPVTFPADAGANFAVNEVFCPGFSVNGVDAPLKLKPVPATMTPEIVVLAVPEFVKVNV
jgi:hypothetical protein